jgi:anti-sigma factor RsiW
MACDKVLLTQAYLDGELDPAAALEIEAHLGACASCRQLIANVTELRDALRTVPRHHPLPPGLEARILIALDEADRAENGKRSLWPAGLRRFLATRRQWLVGAMSGAALAAAVAIALVVLLPSEDDSRFVDNLADAHVRSLMAQHLLDVGSSDTKTVSPWFKGRVDVAPPVVDLTAQGFALEGGRADYVDGKRVAAIVYSHGSHVVNLFVWADYEEMSGASAAERDGYHLFMWPRHKLAFCAVSDMSVDELKTLAHAVNAGMENTASH